MVNDLPQVHVNPRRRVAQRGAMVIGLCVCVCVSESNLALQATRRLMNDSSGSERQSRKL